MTLSPFQEIKQSTSLKEYAEAKLERAKGGNRYVCPFCHSGGHGNAGSDSAFSVKGERFSCFSCGKGGDIFDLAGAVEGIDANDQRAKLAAVARWAGIELEQPRNAAQARPRAASVAKAEARKKPVEEKPAPDLTAGRAKHEAYLLQAKANVEHPEAVAYLEGRGYTVDEAKALGIGYDPATKRLVIPWKGSSYYHIDRDVTGKASHKYSKPKSDEVGAQPLYNPDALNEEAFVVVEGAFDALALETLGIEAVALGGVGISGLVSALQAKAEKPTPLFFFDYDKAGFDARAGAVKAFEEAHLPCVAFFPATYRLNGKDADDMRKADPDALKNALTGELASIRHKRAQEREAAYREALGQLRVVSASDVAAQIFLMEGATEPTPTGFHAFDEAIGGGLPAGLVTLGAISSMGKTTFAVQMADQIAASGRAVLFVTIEQSARELTAKSLSRLTATLPDGDTEAASAGEILDPKRRAAWSLLKTQQLAGACEEYERAIAAHMHIMEGVKQPSASDVDTLARRMAAHDGKPPVIFIDYLQLLAAPSERDTDKQTTDKNVMALRQLARELHTPVVVISSLNRSSYSTGVTLESFKESGAIEYGSDLLLGLQPWHMSYDLQDVDEKKAKGKSRELLGKHKAADVRACELTILKNRSGKVTDEGIAFTFDAPHSLWSEGNDRAGVRVL